MKSQALPCLLLVILTTLSSSQGLGQWVTKSSMPTPRSDHVAVTTGSGTIIVAGGCDSDQLCPASSPFCYCLDITNKMESYDPETDQWTPLADMPRPRFRHAAAVAGGKVYFFGGRDASDLVISEVDIYDIASNTWTASLNWTAPTSDLVAVTIGSTIYAISGYNQDYSSVGTTWTLDTLSSTWGSSQVAPMVSHRGDACAVAIQGKIYVYGGFSDLNFCDPLTHLEVYDPTLNSWTEKAADSTPRGDAACGNLFDDLHIVGGEQKDDVANCSKFDVPVSDVEHYNIPTDTWNVESELPDVRFRFAGATYGNMFCVFGGQGPLDSGTLSHTVLDTVECWIDPEENSSQKNPAITGAFLVGVTVTFLVSLGSI